MGFGHRVYKTGDVRAQVLKEYARRAAEQTGQAQWEEAAAIVEKVLAEEKNLYPNLDWPASFSAHGAASRPRALMSSVKSKPMSATTTIPTYMRSARNSDHENQIR